MKKPPRLYDPNRISRRPTGKQAEARQRNWQIFKLRGLWCQVGILTDERREAARAAIDAELAALGAEPQGARLDREKRERESYETFRSTLIGNLPVY